MIKNSGCRVLPAIATVFLIFLCSCGNLDANNKAPAITANVSSSLATERKTDPVLHDTLSFEKLTFLTRHFQEKISAVEAMKMLLKKQHPGDYSLADSIRRIDASYYNLIKERNNSICKFMETNGINAESFDGLRYLVIDWTIPVTIIDSLFLRFPGHLRNSESGKWLSGKIEKRKVTETQSRFNSAVLDLKYQTTEGKTITLNEISSKYLLLDFWASWCSPCRYENRSLAKEKSLAASGSDLSIVAISLDNNKNKWLKASEEDGLNYISISDLKGFDSQMAKQLKIETIPYNILITKEGKILANNLWGDRLTDFIKSLPKDEDK